MTTPASARHRVDERVGADARVLFVDDAGHDHLAGGQPAALGHDAHGVDHRRDAALHVLRAAAVQPPVAHHRLERRRHAGHAHGVDVSAQHQRRPGRASGERADDVGPSRRHLLHLDRQPDRLELLHEPPRDGRLPRRPRHERGVHRVDGDEIAQQAFDACPCGRNCTGRGGVRPHSSSGLTLRRSCEDDGTMTTAALAARARARRGACRQHARRPRAGRRRLRARSAARTSVEGPRPRGLRRAGGRRCRRCSARSAGSSRWAAPSPSTSSARSTSPCPAASRRAAAATRPSPCRAIRTCRSRTPRAAATSR